MSTWALVKMTRPSFFDAATGAFSLPTDPVPWAGLALIVLAALMLIEAVRAVLGPQRPPSALKPAVAGSTS
jgi:hypothetical protein